MFCTQCGVEIRETDRFCSQCGHQTGRGPAAWQPDPNHRLTRDMANRKIAGVCAGFARYMNVDVVLIRIIWLALALGAGVGFIAYIVAWIIMPRGDEYTALPAGQYANQGTR